MGVNATGCVLETARNALYHKFKIFTSKDLIEDVSHAEPDARRRADSWFYSKETSYFENYKLLINAINPKT